MPQRPDIFRRESFGGFYYARGSRETIAFPQEHADFLLQCTLRPASQVLEEELPSSFSNIRRRAQPTLDEWRASGILDDELMCRARVHTNHPPADVLGAPLATSFELTERCNLHCPHCYVERGTLARQELSPAALGRAFKDLDRAGSPGVTLSGGEPLLRRDIWEILDRARDHQLDVKLCTNATRLDKPTARRLVGYPIHTFSVSLDGPCAEVHDRVRGAGNFDQVDRGVMALRDAGAAKIMLRITVTAHNLDSLAGYAELGDSWKVDAVSFRPFRFNGAALDPTLVVSREDYDQAMQELERSWSGECRASFGSSLPTRAPAFAGYIPRFGCNGGNGTLSVKADGSVVACATVRTPGEWNLKQHDLLESWYHAPSIRQWRQLSTPEQCLACDRLAGCGGGCRARAQALNQGLAGPDLWCCCEWPATA